MPRKLGRAFQATHFTLTKRSEEDWNFERFKKELLVLFSPDENHKLRNLIVSEPAGAETAESKEILEGYRQILKQESSLFVFGAYERIIDLVARSAVDSIGLTKPMTAAIERWMAGFRCFISDVELPPAPGLPSDFINDLGSSRYWLEKEHRAGDDGWPLVEQNFSDFRHLKLRHRYDGKNAWVGISQEPISNVHIYEKGKEDLLDSVQQVRNNFDYLLRWLRSAQSWNYTFIESLNHNGESAPFYFDSLKALLVSCAVQPSVLRAAALSSLPPGRNFPGQLLAGAHYLLIPIDMMIALSIVPATELGFKTESDVLRLFYSIRRSVDPTLEINFAQDFLKAITEGSIVRKSLVSSLFVQIFKFLDENTIRQLLKRHWEANINSSTANSQEDKIKNALIDLIDKILTAPEASKFDTTDALITYIVNNDKALRTRGVYRFLGNSIRAAVSGLQPDDVERAKLLRQLAELTKSFWDFAIAPNLESQIKSRDAPIGIAADDFVCSTMIDGKCLYFSNFMPENEDMFTRTLFVDIGMEGYQSARILQRLTDILTYRSMPIRYLDRANAAVDALLELGMKLNSFQAQKSDPGSLEVLKEQLDKALEVSRSVGRLNTFITYGVDGQWRSAKAYYDQIIERCEDLREERIESYARLNDFVRRRLAHSIRFIERMHGHQQTVTQRVSELLDRIRTELDATQTRQISGALDKQNETMTSLGNTVVELKIVSTTMDQNIEAQTKQLIQLKGISNDTKLVLGDHSKTLSELSLLLKAAEALILIGSTYYLSSYFLGYVAEGWAWKNDPVKVIGTFAAAFVLSFAFMKTWPLLSECVGKFFRARGK